MFHVPLLSSGHTRRERLARVIARKSGHTERVTRASFNQRVTLPRGSYLATIRANTPAVYTNVVL